MRTAIILALAALSLVACETPLRSEPIPLPQPRPLSDAKFIWPKNSLFVCRGVPVQNESKELRLEPDDFMFPPKHRGNLTWCDADIPEPHRTRVLKTCSLNATDDGGCEIKGVIMGHGAFSWVKVISVKRIAERC